MTRSVWLIAIGIAVATFSQSQHAEAGSIKGKVVDAKGKPMAGVMLSAFDEKAKKSTSVFSQPDGSYMIEGLPDKSFNVRARLLGMLDVYEDDVDTGTHDLAFTMKPATGDELQKQRTGDAGFAMLKWDNMRDKANFKMMCMYCHQAGTYGFRTPEKPVDWHTMIRRMDGFGGLYRHTQKTIVKRIFDTYNDKAVKKWPKWVPPPAPTGLAAKVRITEWRMGVRFKSVIHDIEPGHDGLMYAVDIAKQTILTVDPKTDRRNSYRFPRGSYGPHSIELGNDGHMWVTLCASGQMGKFDLKTKKFTICSSAEPPARRGSYPHTLRIDPKDKAGLIWYTDAGRNSCFSLHPKTLVRKEYHLLRKNQAVAAGKGESRGITPYGIDYSPVDGMIWYSKLNGNRIGRIDPKAPDGDIKEWNPPFRGPRRLHVAQDGMVWVPGFGSGKFGKFNPKTERWTVYDLPDAENQIPYALNIDAKGNVWICGTGNDCLYRFNPKTERLVEIRLPTRVSYTREIEFDKQGNIWTCNSNGPPRHIDGGFGSVIRIELLAKDDGSGIKLKAREYPGNHSVGYKLEPTNKSAKTSSNAKLLSRIDRMSLPKAYNPQRGKTSKEHARIHQAYVDARMKKLSDAQRSRIARLWKEQERIHPKMRNRGYSFVKIMEYVANNEK